MSDAAILLVDDETTVCKTLVLAFETVDLTSIVVGSAAEALSTLKTKKFDLLVLDKNLPGMSGIDLLRQIRAEGNQTPVIMITGFASASSALEMVHLGIEAFVEKPFLNLFNVVDRMKEVVERSRLTSTKHGTNAASGHFSKASALLQAASAQRNENGLRYAFAGLSYHDRTWLSERMVVPGDQIDEYVSPKQIQDMFAQRIDCLVVDINIAKPNVFELVQRAHQQSNQTICVVIAERTALSSIVKLIDLRVAAIVERPFRDDALRRGVLSLLSTRRKRIAKG